MTSIASQFVTFPEALSFAPVHAFSVDEYHGMIESGLLTAQHRVELLEGVVVDMPPIGPSHAVGVEDMSRAFQELRLDGWCVRSQLPITLARSEPTPDVAIVRGTHRDYVSRHPGPGDVAIVVEVASTSITFDRGPKLAIYAEAGISEYWIVDLANRRIEVHRAPVATTSSSRAAYGEIKTVQVSETVNVVLDGNVVGSIEARAVLV